ncbi:WD40-like beta Propeller containing protein [Gemmatirosa kalamazoonensis]|uniref:WD40-like beta Propeller containing protein n=1 Tax=Gemmatirosa kalamazoonensis TaxID=861299 RepID=W0RG03_9BACT|nr:prolyl oligopeptidase family serine peptidase [Gemmatirosa kalamazoonensis]AHG88323.1 WD40-like beta Propeller containing protein [Gemmatirosa kalamazoonensis]
MQLRIPLLLAVAASSLGAQAKRPMTWLDVQQIRQVGGAAPSPDGRWVLYTVSFPDWQNARRQSDVFVVSAEQGLSSTRQLTFTKDKNETNPTWSRDGSFFVFASDRDAPAATPNATPNAAPTPGPGAAGGRNQLYLMHPDGGEARRITDARDGVSTFAFSKDGRWLAYRSGRAGEEQLYRLPVAALVSGGGAVVDSLRAEQLTRQPAGVGLWRWAPDSKRIYFVTADTVDLDEKLRREKRFTVSVRNMAVPPSSLWAIDLDPSRVTRLTRDTTFSVASFTISDDGKWVGFRGASANRYERNITEENDYADNWLLEVATGRMERLTNNREVGESAPSFSPDGQWVAFAAPDDLTRYSLNDTRVYLRRVDDRGGQWRKLGTDYDGDVSVDFWAPDSKTIYFNDGVRATNQLLALDVAKGTVRQVTRESASVRVTRDEDSKRVLVTYADPSTPNVLFAVPPLDQIGNRAAWKQLTDANPQVRGFALGEEREIGWRSKDGTHVGGLLVTPVGYQPGTRYPLIVAIHGGPAGADVLSFNPCYGAQVYAGAGYAVLCPNYRGSTNYGQAFKTGIVGNYFDPGYQDIMAGVDSLIAAGVVDADRMGVLGWSAGGHWSNWILTHTDRFKAISTGAGTANWISMFAESDMQRVRQFYLGDKLPYEDFDAYWNQSPLKYIKNAKTPTMIHVVEGDPRVPRPQSEELHMALKRLGVPTEFYVYPGSTHGIPDPRNQLFKSTVEMAWMDYWVRGSGKRFAWRDVLKTVEDEANRAADRRAATSEQR